MQFGEDTKLCWTYSSQVALISNYTYTSQVPASNLGLTTDSRGALFNLQEKASLFSHPKGKENRMLQFKRIQHQVAVNTY